MVTDRSQFHYFTRWVEWGRRIVCIFGQEAYELDARVGGGVDFHCRESAEDSVEKKILRKRGPKNLSPPSISSLCCCLVRDTRELKTREIDMQRPLDQRSRSSKPTTIHGCAQSGDLLALQKLLRGNPSLLNDRNPVVRSLFLPLSVCPFIWVFQETHFSLYVVFPRMMLPDVIWTDDVRRFGFTVLRIWKELIFRVLLYFFCR